MFLFGAIFRGHGRAGREYSLGISGKRETNENFNLPVRGSSFCNDDSVLLATLLISLTKQFPIGT